MKLQPLVSLSVFTIILFILGFTPVMNQHAFADAVITTSSNTNTGQCSDDCEEPTLGVNSNGKRLVSNGFTYNGNPVDVQRYFTPYPLISVNIGEENRADFKIYENMGPENIKHFSFGFGLGKDQVISQSKAMIELDIDFTGKETISLTDPENVLEDVRVETNHVSCDDDSRVTCLGVTIYHTFRAPLDFNIVGTDVWDSNRNSWQNYYNHGIEIVGKSLNPLPTNMIPSPEKNVGLVLVTQVDKKNDYWITNDGKMFERNNSNSYKQINLKFERFQDTGNVFSRTHSEFGKLIEYEKMRAVGVFDADSLVSNLPSSFEHDIKISERINDDIRQKMLLEESIAKDIIEKKYEVTRNL